MYIFLPQLIVRCLENVSVEDKRRIVDAHTNGEDCMETARLLEIKRTTAWSIIQNHQHRG